MSKLKKYQRVGVAKIARFNGIALLADEMGLGKSIQSLAWWYNRRRTVSPLIIVCPAYLKLNWRREVRTHLNLRATILSGRKGRSLIHRGSAPQIIIINYEIVMDWLPFLKKIKPKTLIIDEAHYVQNRDAQRAKAVKSLSRCCPHTIALSGTPLTSRPMQLWNVLNILNPKRWKSFMHFAHRYCAPKRTKWGWDYRGAARLPELHRILNKEIMIRRLKEDVLKELPPKERHIVLLDMKNRRDYEDAESDIVSWMQKQSTAKAKKALKAKQLVLMSTLRQLVAEGKIDSVIEWIQNFLEETNRKLIVFAHHKRVVKGLHDAFPKTSLVVSGDTPAKHRLQIADTFNNSRTRRLLIGNFQAAGTGLNLQAASDIAVVEFPWNPGDILQAEDRAHRIGQKKQVTVWFLATEGTIEEDLSKLIQKKQGVLSSVLDGQKRTARLNVFDYLNNAIKKRGKKNAR